jgi:nucleoid-associated protein YgaU
LAAEEGAREEQAAALAGGSQWFQLYHVEPGDTLSGIALWWFGSSEERFWRRIWLANRRTIGPNPNLIRSSQWLRLPFSGFNYHVERGDTLSQLAQWVYGDGNQWERIHDANPWIQDPDQIQRSWWIWIPG